MSIVGRIEEKELLTDIVNQTSPCFVALYGRRRVGKTFLVKEFFNHQFSFYTTGLAKGNTKAQLANFHSSLQTYFSSSDALPTNWMQAFKQLENHLKKVKGKKVIFIDELPWLDTKRSDFMMAVEAFWNSWASTQKNLKLIVCGSAASWMINELINETGGLYNRVTHRMKIHPFTLAESELFLKSKGISLTRYQITKLYMTLGGIPFYLDLIRKGESDVQSIDRLCFSKGGMLKTEFDFIYKSLFDNYDKYKLIITKMFELGRQASREAISKACGIQSSGDFTDKLNDLEESGFITSYIPFGKNKSNKIYLVSDYFSLFHLRFIANHNKVGKGFWAQQLRDSSVFSWMGLSFELICFDHIQQIKKALGIEGVYCETSPWYYKGHNQKSGAQIDLVIDRRDNVINLCEIKFSESKFSITKAYDLQLRNKQSVFAQETNSKKALFTTMITTYGLVSNAYATSFVQNSIELNQLFL
jgi:uncharacterized protein